MRLRKRIIALGLTCVLAVLPVIPSQAAVWKQENGKWRYYLSNGFMATNTMKSNSNGNEWWWLGDDGYILEGHGGEIVTNNGRINFRLKDDGQVDPNGWDADGNTYDLRAIMTQGKNKNFKSCWGILNDNDDQSNAWIYYDEQGKKVSEKVYEIDGEKYYFDKDGEIKWNQTEKVCNGHYMAGVNDAALATDRWILFNHKWYYFDENGAQVLGKKTINHETYDFGDDGYLAYDKLELPRVESIELHTDQTEAKIGDTVTIPFTIMVKEKVYDEPETPTPSTPSNASPSNASPSNADRAYHYETVEANYDLFKHAYAINRTFRVNVGDMNTTYVAGKSKLRYGVEYKYNIDWDRQVIEFPVQYLGAVFGKLEIDGKQSNEFGIVVNYPDDVSPAEQYKDLMKNPYKAEVISSLKNLDQEELKGILLESEDLQNQYQYLEMLNNGDQSIDTYVSVDKEAEKYIDTDEVSAIGLGFSANRDTVIGLKVGMSDEHIPEDIKSGNTIVPLDIEVKAQGGSKSELDAPAIITVPKPNGISGSDFTIYHIHDGVTEEVPYAYDSETGDVLFVANEYSTFVFAQSTNNGNSGSSGSSSGGSSGGNSQPTGKWMQDQIGWWYKFNNGTYPTNIWLQLPYANKTDWYHFDEKGYINVGWFTDKDGRMYYLNPLSNNYKGAMLTGWQLIDGQWYYFNAVSNGYKGELLKNTTTPDGYQVNEKGQWLGK